MNTIPKYVLLASLLLAAGIALSAFGAHALRERLDAYHMAVFEKASFYHLVHALGMLVVCSLATPCALSENSVSRICLSLCFGILFFSGSLYLLSVTGVKWLGAITPIGGTLFILSWVLLAFETYKQSN